MSTLGIPILQGSWNLTFFSDDSLAVVEKSLNTFTPASSSSSSSSSSSNNNRINYNVGVNTPSFTQQDMNTFDNFVVMGNNIFSDRPTELSSPDDSIDDIHQMQCVIDKASQKSFTVSQTLNISTTKGVMLNRNK